MYKKKIFLSLLFFVAFFIFACENVSKAKADEFENATTQIIKSDDKVNANIENSENEFQIELPTPHNEAEFGEIAKTVLMPGDPLRSKYIAENFLENAELVNNVRGIQGYTGKWKGVPVTVMSSGMGIPSMGIYSWELYTGYGVENIIRIGTAGGLQDNINVKDVVIAEGACTDSSFMHQFDLNGTFAPIADYTLLQTAVEIAKNKGIKPFVGNVLSTDNFYDDGSDSSEKWKKMGVLAVEMEAAGLYANAARLGKKALVICTISDHVFNPSNDLNSEEREKNINQMIEIALDTAVSLKED